MKDKYFDQRVFPVFTNSQHILESCSGHMSNPGLIYFLWFHETFLSPSSTIPSVYPFLTTSKWHFHFPFFFKKKQHFQRQDGVPIEPGPTSESTGLAEVPGSQQPLASCSHVSGGESGSQGEQHIVEHDKYASKIFKNQIIQIKLILRDSCCQGSLVHQSA